MKKMLEKIKEGIRRLSGIQFDAGKESYQLDWCIETNQAISIVDEAEKEYTEEMAFVEKCVDEMKDNNYWIPIYKNILPVGNQFITIINDKTHYDHVLLSVPGQEPVITGWYDQEQKKWFSVKGEEVKVYAWRRRPEAWFPSCPEEEPDYEPEIPWEEQYVEEAASILPSGWFWKMYNDGSGDLVSPEGKRFYSYDKSPYYKEGWIEYQIEYNSRWDIFYGKFEPFKEFAEKEMQKTLKK